jgi:hypothetical protein
VIDYTTDDFTTRGERYDRIFIAVGNRVHPPSRAGCAASFGRPSAASSLTGSLPSPSARWCSGWAVWLPGPCTEGAWLL